MQYRLTNFYYLGFDTQQEQILQYTNHDRGVASSTRIDVASMAAGPAPLTARAELQLVKSHRDIAFTP